MERFKDFDVVAKCINSGDFEMERLITYDNHPNIIRSCGFVSNKQYCYIFSEFCRCSLDKSINFYSSKETEKDKSTTNPTLIKLMQENQLWDANHNTSDTW